jgi:hypothetical protein
VEIRNFLTVGGVRGAGVGEGEGVLAGTGVGEGVGGTRVGVGVGPPAPKPQAKDIASSKDTIKNRNTLRFVMV